MAWLQQGVPNHWQWIGLDLDLARQQLESIGKVAQGKAAAEYRVARIQKALAETSECLNRIFANHHFAVEGD